MNNTSVLGAASCPRKNQISLRQFKLIWNIHHLLCLAFKSCTFFLLLEKIRSSNLCFYSFAFLVHVFRCMFQAKIINQSKICNSGQRTSLLHYQKNTTYYVAPALTTVGITLCPLHCNQLIPGYDTGGKQWCHLTSAAPGARYGGAK